jgi:hypothetical protein
MQGFTFLFSGQLAQQSKLKDRAGGLTFLFSQPFVVSTPAPPIQNSIFWLNVGGVWKQTTPFVNGGGVWKQATPFINVGGVWK